METTDGVFIPSIKYDASIKEEDGQIFNDIDWRKLKLTKTNLTRMKIESLKPADYAYHNKYGYL